MEPRFKVVHALSWEKSICSVLFESDDEETALSQATLLSDTLKDAYEVVDSWNLANKFPSNAKALLKTPQEVARWCRREAANRQRSKASVKRLPLRRAPPALGYDALTVPMHEREPRGRRCTKDLTRHPRRPSPAIRDPTPLNATLGAGGPLRPQSFRTPAPPGRSPCAAARNASR